jgi:hypothetical protein
LFRRRRGLLRSATAALALPAFALALAGCGLENVPILSQPGFLIPSGDVFRFKKILANGDATEPGFRGYDIYYKIYKISSLVDINILTIEELAQKFRRLTFYTTSGGVFPSPLVPIASADLTASFEINVDFSPDLLDEARPQLKSIPNTPDTPTSPIDIEDFRRGLGVTYTSSSETKRFAHFAENDADIDPTIWADIEVSAEVLIAAYVVSYGVDAQYGALYSIPLYLQTIQLQLPAGP